jgi:UDP-N-acetylmuramyl pentapeptide phosphotransferase/UDP-N-acetylglucosamine-1-phosphate transferase
MAALPVWISLHFVVAALCTAWAIRYAHRRELFDHPGERRSHASKTPRGGGIGIAAALLLGNAWLLHAWPGHRPVLAAGAAGLVLVAAVGWWDDHRPLSPWPRLAVQAVAAALLALAVRSSGGDAWQAAAAFVLAMSLVNVWNFMDGINGLASSQALIAAAGFALVLPAPWNRLAAGLAAACAGFLPFNFPRARIFLGDVGSGSLGYALATLLGAGLLSMPGQSRWLLAMPVSAFAIDAGFTLAWRILRGERWWTPHVEHVYQRWARRHGHVRTAVAYGLFSIAAAGMMLLCLRPGRGVEGWYAGIWYLMAASVWVWAHGKRQG